MPTPFFVVLEKNHTVPKYTSYKDTPQALELRTLFSTDTDAYTKKRDEYKAQGYKFRLTKGELFEIKDKGETIDVKVALQVKGGSLTWYFLAPNAMDQYPQEFRDRLFFPAVECHKQVEHGCGQYYRGSNAIHIKLMHDDESESNNNHNHYRLQTGMEYTPVEFNQHLQAFKTLEDKTICEQFFSEGEIDRLCEKFQQFHETWTKKVDDEPSLQEQYAAQPSQQLILEDFLELLKYGMQQGPCRLNIDDLKIDYESARREIEQSIQGKGLGSIEKAELTKKITKQYRDILHDQVVSGGRGLGAELALTRQIEGSQYKAIHQVVQMDDGRSMGVDADWSDKRNESFKTALQHLLKNAFDRLAPLDHVDTPHYIEETSRSSSFKKQPKLSHFHSEGSTSDTNTSATSIRSQSRQSARTQSPESLKEVKRRLYDLTSSESSDSLDSKNSAEPPSTTSK